MNYPRLVAASHRNRTDPPYGLKGTTMLRRFLMSSGSQIFRDPREPAGDFDPLEDFIDDPNTGEDDDDDDGGTGFDDQDDEDADGDDEDQDDEDQEPEPRRAKKPSRANARIEALLAENAELKAKNAQPATIAQPGPSQAELDRQETAHMATLTPEGRLAYQLEKSNRLNEQRFNMLQFQNHDAADKAAFERLCAKRPALGKIATKVEEALAEMRSKGNTAPRETVASFLIGQQVLKGKSNAPRQRAKADENRSRETARPGAQRSDARPASGRSTDQQARKKRLQNVNI